MRKSLAAVAALASLAAAAWAAESIVQVRGSKVAGPFTEAPVAGRIEVPAVPGDANYRKPVLKAAGTQRVDKGEERITIPVDGVAYEVVVTKPGLGAMIPLDH